MAKPKRRQPDLALVPDEKPVRWAAPPPLRPLTHAQGLFMSSLRSNSVTFAVGSAGTGKTMLATAYAADQLRDKKIDKIIITRPAVEAGESLGFLPGDVDSKVLPYILPIRSILYERLGQSFTDYCIKSGRIEVIPLAFMRGHTLKNCAVLFDEAQNSTCKQMLLFLSRLGENVTVAVTGDINQSDLKGPNGLEDALHRLKDLPDVGFVTFTKQDIVRSGLCQQIIERYEIS